MVCYGEAVVGAATVVIRKRVWGDEMDVKGKREEGRDEGRDVRRRRGSRE